MTETSRRVVRIDLFAFILATMAFAWAFCSFSGIGRKDVVAQLIVLFFVALVWFAICTVLTVLVRWAIRRKAQRAL